MPLIAVWKLLSVSAPGLGAGRYGHQGLLQGQQLMVLQLLLGMTVPGSLHLAICWPSRQ